MTDKYQEVVKKLCQIYENDTQKCTEILDILAIEDAKCGGREHSAMWNMLTDLMAFDQQFKLYSVKLVSSADKMPPSRPATPLAETMDVKGKSPIHSRPGTPMSPYYPELSHTPAPSAKCVRKWMFFLKEHTKSTVICVHPRFFVTFRHGSHRRFNIGDNVKLYHAQMEVDDELGVDVRVARIYETCDFILLKSEFDVVDHKPPIAPVEESEPFILAGFGNDTGFLSYLPGSIHSVQRHYFSGMGPYILGTSLSSCGDSGGGIWGSRGLIGMNYGCTMMPLKNHQEAISEAAIFSPKNIIYPAVEFEKAFMEELEAERKEEKSPPNKKSCLVTVVDGCTLYGDRV